MINWRSWGLSWNESFCRTIDWECRQCGWSYFSHNRVERAKYVVGFSTNQPFPSGQIGIVGILIVECPNCFSKFWFHIPEDNLIKQIDLTPDFWPIPLGEESNEWRRKQHNNFRRFFFKPVLILFILPHKVMVDYQKPRGRNTNGLFCLGSCDVTLIAL